MTRLLIGSCALVIAPSFGGLAMTTPSTACAQIASITGHVLDVVGQPLPGTSVTAILQSGGPTHRATADADGAYRFEMLPEGTYRVDFDVQGFDLARRNHVQVRNNAPSVADVVLSLSALCECIGYRYPLPLQERAGRVLDAGGRPLPHARLLIVSPVRREAAHADEEGRFRVRVPVDGTWPLTASDTGFTAVIRWVSAVDAAPILFTLGYAGAPGAPDNQRLEEGCRCPELFTHEGQ
jgi:carboxypeptidase family protein